MSEWGIFSGNGKTYGKDPRTTEEKAGNLGLLGLGTGLFSMGRNLYMGLQKPDETDPSDFDNPYESEIMDMYNQGMRYYEKDPAAKYYEKDPAAKYYDTNKAMQYYDTAGRDINASGRTMGQDLSRSEVAARGFSDQAISTLRNRKLNIDPILQQADLANRVNDAGARQYSNTGAEYMNRRAMGLSNRTRDMANAYAAKSNTENQYLGESANAMLGRSGMEAQFGQNRMAMGADLLRNRLANYGAQAASAQQFNRDAASSASAFNTNAASSASAFNTNAANARFSGMDMYAGLGNQRANADMYADGANKAAKTQKQAYMDAFFGDLGGLGMNLASLGFSKYFGN